MTFEGQYLTYAEYQALGGSAIGEMPFNLLEFEARKQIDLKTQSRLKKCESIPQEVKICEYNLINSIINNFTQNNNNVNSNVASESIDGYSISYITADKIKEIIKSKSAEFNDIIITDLNGLIINNEHLIYCGIK